MASTNGQYAIPKGMKARGGKLVYYGVYEKEAVVNVSPSKVFGDEITIIG
jgi:hypothetical protein